MYVQLCMHTALLELANAEESKTFHDLPQNIAI